MKIWGWYGAFYTKNITEHFSKNRCFFKALLSGQYHTKSSTHKHRSCFSKITASL